ncbi:MAG: hypothetical protein U1A23_00955 [Candidatus Sungbacteria bacterium]|nr:hypothetical protein [bacterium]MDZ4285477.1 hypothetical protein [Candidatus Sungbacteria bacterium]
MEKHPLHLKNPELQTSPEVQRAVEREEQKTGEKVPNDPAERIEAYMDRLENIFLNPDERKRERNLEMFRDKIYDALIIKRENFPDSYFELQKRIARERGQAVEEIPENVREQMVDVAIEDQKASLDAWMDYLTSEDAVYPAWFKYFVWRNVTKLSQFDKERGEFKKRTDSTVARFPDIYKGALAKILDVYTKVKEDNKNLKEPEIREAFGKKFPNLYAELISKSLAASMENREEIRGEWIKYEQGRGGDAEKLFRSLDNKGTGWCTEGIETAKVQIESGDFYVYYTNDSSGEPTQPRLAIRIDGDNRIGEVRGILPHQGVEPVMQEALDSKLSEFGGEADAYRKKSEDMRMLTALEKKHENDEPFTKDDLVLLYEINGTIEGFGYQKDPRIAELRQGRNTEEDMLVIFECVREQIAHVPSQINENTKAYFGQLEPGIFQKLPENLEHVYTSFPEKKIRRENIEIGGKSAEQLISEMEAAGINISDYAKSMLKNREFVPGKNPEEATLIRLTVADLGFKSSATTDQIYERAQILGLELCPADTGPNYRLKYQNQPLKEWIYMGMKQITDSDGNPIVFELGRVGGGLWLDGSWARPDREWYPGDRFVFRLRKQTADSPTGSES